MIELLDIKSIDVIADWVELNIIYSSDPISKSKLIAIMEENGAEDDPDYGEELCDSVLQELQKRAQWYGNKAPYKINNNVVEPLLEWREIPEYVMCLLFSYLGAANSHTGTKLFERLSNEALKSYLNGETVTFGFPNTRSLKEEIDALAIELCEKKGNRDPTPYDKDRGVDVIGWKPFKDGRGSQIVVLMQCAAGRNWTLKKPVPLTTWSQFIHWNFSITIPCICITQILENKNWQNRVDDYGIIFDRARIYRTLYDNFYSIDANLRDEIRTWCESKLN